jgi:hypothetical protein
MPILQDQETLKVPMRFMDSAGRSRVTDAALHRPGFRVTNDAAMRDVKQKAYTEYERRLVNAWRDAANPPTGAGSHGPIGAREGDLCTIDGAPGHLHRIGGRLICIPDKARRRDAMPVQDERQQAYDEYDAQLVDAWRTAR